VATLRQNQLTGLWQWSANRHRLTVRTEQQLQLQITYCKCRLQAGEPATKATIWPTIWIKAHLLRK